MLGLIIGLVIGLGIALAVALEHHQDRVALHQQGRAAAGRPKAAAAPLWPIRTSRCTATRMRPRKPPASWPNRPKQPRRWSAPPPERRTAVPPSRQPESGKAPVVEKSAELKSRSRQARCRRRKIHLLSAGRRVPRAGRCRQYQGQAGPARLRGARHASACPTAAPCTGCGSARSARSKQ